MSVCSHCRFLKECCSFVVDLKKDFSLTSFKNIIFSVHYFFCFSFWVEEKKLSDVKSQPRAINEQCE
jgi:hypothetical protein